MRVEKNCIWRRWDYSVRAIVYAALAIIVLGPRPTEGQTFTASLVPDADSFVRVVAPASNYGAAGALSVSGAAATNGAGDVNGLAATLMRFSLSNAVAGLDEALGGPDWIVTEARLVVNEMAAPENTIFCRGVGAFEVRWIAADGWIEGTGKPMAPTGDGVAWQDLTQILNSNLDVSLGVFTNSGANAQVSFTLDLADRAVQDFRAGGEFGLYLAAQSQGIGFTFYSRNFGNTNAQPVLIITAAVNPRPRIDAIELAGTNVTVSFATVSNWNYALQYAGVVAANGSANWSNLLTVPQQAVGSNVVFREPAMDRQRLYRLSVSR